MTRGELRALAKEATQTEGWDKPGVDYAGRYQAKRRLGEIAPQLALLCVDLATLIEDVGYSDKDRWKYEVEVAFARLEALDAA